MGLSLRWGDDKVGGQRRKEEVDESWQKGQKMKEQRLQKHQKRRRIQQWKKWQEEQEVGGWRKRWAQGER